MALFILTFDNKTRIIKFKKLYNAIMLGHLKNHLEMHRGERTKVN